MKRRKIKRRYYNSKNVLIIVALGITAAIITALLSSFFIRVNARDNFVIKEFSVSSSPNGITAGPDGNIWFTEFDDKIGRITLNGKVTEFSIPTSNSDPYNITAGPDGNLWFTELNPPGKIGRITPNGAVTEFLVPNDNNYSGITAGPDGNLWFTAYNGNNKIGRINPNGEITEYPLPTNGDPYDITSGPDGNLWFTENSGNKIGRITPNGTITEFLISSNYIGLNGITAGQDGNLWFTESSGNKIGRIAPDGVVTEFSIPTNDSYPVDITAGPDGNIWFTESAGNKIGRITPSGTITEFVVPTNNSDPTGITAGADGNIWFTENNSGKIGRVNLSPDKGPDRDFVELLSPFNNGVTWTVSQGYYNNKDQSGPGCHIGTGPDHCRNQLFGLDMVPDQQSDKEILAPGNGIVAFGGKLEDEDCIGLRIILDNGLNMNVCHFASFNVSKGERIIIGKVLGIRSSSHVHLSLDDRYRIGTLCPGKERCFLPIPFDGQHTIEGISFDPNPNGETVLLPYPLCGQRKVDCQFEVDFQQYQGTFGTSTNVAIP